MLAEYNIWKKIFDECLEEELEEYLGLVINSEEAIDYLYDRIMEYRDKIKYKITLNINLDPSMKDVPLEELSNLIIKGIKSSLKNKEIFN